MELTEQLIPELSAPSSDDTDKTTQVFYRDSTLTGFAVRVSSGGTKSYILERRIRGKVKRITLGRCDDIPFHKARARAEKLIAEVERENAPRIVNGQVVHTDLTLADAYTSYIEHHTLNQLTLDDYQRSLDGPLAAWQTMAVTNISREMVLDKYQSYSDKYPARCDNAMRLLRAVINYVRWHMLSDDHRPILKFNPVEVLTEQKLWQKKKSTRSRFHINGDRLACWWRASLQIRKVSTQEFLQCLLLTGYNAQTLAGLRFDDVDNENMSIRVKSGSSEDEYIVLPIPKYVADKIYTRAVHVFRKSEYVFPGLTPDKPLSDPRTSIYRVNKLSDVQLTLKDLHQCFILLAKQAGFDKAVLTLSNRVYRGKTGILSQDEITDLRMVQERIFLNIFYLIGAAAINTP